MFLWIGEAEEGELKGKKKVISRDLCETSYNFRITISYNGMN